MSVLKVPIVVIITGEGGSGGALGIAIGDRILMQEYAIYSVIPPEGCAAILWRDAGKKVEAAQRAEADRARSARERHHRRDRPRTRRRRPHEPRRSGDARRRSSLRRAGGRELSRHRGQTGEALREVPGHGPRRAQILPTKRVPDVADSCPPFTTEAASRSEEKQRGLANA